MWRVLPVFALVMASCGGTDATGDTSTAPVTTTSVTVSTSAATTTTTAAAPVTTVAPATTTTEAEDEPWVKGTTVLVAGDCFNNVVVSGAAPDLEYASCDAAHDGEVIGTGASCPSGISHDEFTALGAAYVGVAEDEFTAWMNGEGLMALSKAQFGPGGVLTSSICLLVTEGGDLYGSYRATG
jgi:hypothetical protein